MTWERLPEMGSQWKQEIFYIHSENISLISIIFTVNLLGSWNKYLELLGT